MCGFVRGDEVFAVGAPDDYMPEHPRVEWPFDPNAVYVVEDVICFGREFGLVVAGLHSPHWTKAWNAICFRKVERRNDRLGIEAFLTIKPGFEEPKRAPAKQREPA